MKKRLIIAFSIILTICLIILNIFLCNIFNLNLLLVLLFTVLIDLFLIMFFALIFKTNHFMKYLNIILNISVIIICYLKLSQHLVTLFITIPLGLLTLAEIINHIVNFKYILENKEYIKYFEKKKYYGLINISLYYFLASIVNYLKLLSVVAFFNCLKEEAFTDAFNLSTIIAFIVMLIGVIIYIWCMIAKIKEKNQLYPTRMVFKSARYPDVLAKILVYIGAYLVLLSVNSTLWVLFLGPLSFVIYYCLIVIPLKEKQLINEDNKYLERIKETNLLLIDRKIIQKK